MRWIESDSGGHVARKLLHRDSPAGRNVAVIVDAPRAYKSPWPAAMIKPFSGIT